MPAPSRAAPAHASIPAALAGMPASICGRAEARRAQERAKDEDEALLREVQPSVKATLSPRNGCSGHIGGMTIRLARSGCSASSRPWTPLAKSQLS